MLDVERYPSLARWLDELPAGLDSHPHCRAKAAVLRAGLSVQPNPPDWPGLPPQLVELLLDPPSPSDWIPEVHNCAAHLALWDRTLDGSNEALRSWARIANERYLEGPLYRVYTQMVPWRFFLRAFPWGWSNTHPEVEARIEASATGALLRFSHLPHLMPAEYQVAVAVAIEVLFGRAMGLTAGAELVEQGPTGFVVEGRW